MNRIFSFAVLLLVFEWLLRLWFILYIPKKRAPSSAIAWLLVVFLLPEIGIILFFLIGNPKLSKQRRAKQQYVDKLIDRSVKRRPNLLRRLLQPQKERYQPIIQLAQTLGRMPLSRGNKAKMLPEYDQAIREITRQIGQAKEFVHIEYFIITLDETTQPVFNAMAAAIARGVTVRVLIDALSYLKYPKRRQMKRLLNEIGVKWHLMLPFRIGKGYNRPDLRNHRKIVVIDDEIAFMGSQNLIRRDYHRKDDIIYDELVVKLTGPIVRQCDTLFVGDWYAETGEKLQSLVDPVKRPLVMAAGNVDAQIVPSGPGYEVLGNLRLFTQLIYTAQSRIVITNPYFVPDESLLVACKSAAQRGVEVIIINSEVMDQIGVGYAQRSFYEELLEVGVKIYLHRAPILLHSKHLTIDDDIAVIGSSNMDMRSFILDLECTVVLYSKSVVRELRKIQAIDLSNSFLLSIEEWQKRKLRHKMLERIMRLTSALQ